VGGGEVAGGLADSGYPPEFVDGAASADRADAELAAAGGDVDRAAPVRGLELRFKMTEAPTETVEDVIRPAVAGGLDSDRRGAGVRVDGCYFSAVPDPPLMDS
jgi:hypothetical protein